MLKPTKRLLLLFAVLLMSTAPAMGAIVTVEEIFQFGVNGGDMAGNLQVTANFADGTSESILWAQDATTPYRGRAQGTRWFLAIDDNQGRLCGMLIPPVTGCGDTQPIGQAGSRDAAMLRGVWTLENESGDPNKLITSVELTGQGTDPDAMTIFDQFFADDPLLFNGPDDFGTPGSQLGFDFSASDPLLRQSETFGAFGAYLDPIQLAGSMGPLGDVYATFLLQIEDPLGRDDRLQFLLDTDIARPAPPTGVPIPSTLLLMGLGALGLGVHRRRIR